MFRLSLFILSSIFSSQVSATMFMPQPLEEQIKHSDGVLVGHFLKKESVEIEDGQIATKMFFSVEQEFGLQTDIFKTNEVIVHYPGGQLADRGVKVDGVPQLMVGTPVVLMIKNVNNRFWGMNLALGTFHIVKYGDDKVLVNKVFPNQAGLGQTSFYEFEKLVRKVKGESLKVVHSSLEDLPAAPTRAIASVPEREQVGNFRDIASKPQRAENDDGTPYSQIGWLMGVLAGLGIISTWRRRHR